MNPVVPLRAVSVMVLVAILAFGAGCESVSLSEFGPALEDDAALSNRVRAALAESPETLNQSIRVRTLDAGLIRLSGFVDNDSIAFRAEQIADAVPGVTGVVNTLQVE